MTHPTLLGYRQNQVMHTSLEKLIVLLYEGAITFTMQAQESLQNQDNVTAGIKLLRARNIVSELHNGLDYEQGGELAQNLKRLYQYVHDELVRAMRENNPTLLPPVVDVLTTLKEGWQAVSEKAESNIPERPPASRQTHLGPAWSTPTSPGENSGLSIKV